MSEAVFIRSGSRLVRVEAIDAVAARYANETDIYLRGGQVVSVVESVAKIEATITRALNDGSPRADW